MKMNKSIFDMTDQEIEANKARARNNIKSALITSAALLIFWSVSVYITLG